MNTRLCYMTWANGTGFAGLRINHQTVKGYGIKVVHISCNIHCGLREQIVTLLHRRTLAVVYHKQTIQVLGNIYIFAEVP